MVPNRTTSRGIALLGNMIFAPWERIPGKDDVTPKWEADQEEGRGAPRCSLPFPATRMERPAPAPRSKL